MNKSIKLPFIVSLLVVFLNLQTFGRETIASVSLENLYKQSDFVAFIKILSGDSEHYDGAIYKAKVLKAYKGAKQNEIIYFGEHISYGIGNEYLAFFEKNDETVGQQINKDVQGGDTPYDAGQSFFRITYGGYSIMPVAYECLFDGQSVDKCDYGVQLNVKQILLPKTITTFPRENKAPSSSDVRLVKRKIMETSLEVLRARNL